MQLLVLVIYLFLCSYLCFLLVLYSKVIDEKVGSHKVMN